MFKRNILKKVLEGKKTVTRRPVERKRGRRIYEIGEKVGITNRYKKPDNFIVITRKSRQVLGDMTEEDARKEGFESLEEFQKAWKRIYGEYNPKQVVWVYEFKPANSD